MISVTISSSNSSPREDDRSTSPKGSANASPLKSSDSFDSIETDSPDVQTFVFERGNSLCQGKASVEKKESVLESFVGKESKSLTYSASLETSPPEPLLERKQNVKTPLIHLLLDTKNKKEELQQGTENDKPLTLPLNLDITAQKEPLEKFKEIIESPISSIKGENPQTDNQIIVDRIQENPSINNLVITPTKLEEDSSKPLYLPSFISIPTPIVDSFPHDDGQVSTSGRNSPDVLDDTNSSTCIKCVSIQALPNLLPTIASPSTDQKENDQILGSSSPLGTSSLIESKNSKPVLPKNSFEEVADTEGKKSKAASSETIAQPIEEAVQIHRNSDETAEKKRVEEKKDILIPNNVAKDDLNEKTPLFPKKRPVLEVPKKTINLQETKQKDPVRSDNLPFRIELEGDSFEEQDRDIKIGNPEEQVQDPHQDLGEGWVDLGQKGNSLKSYELQSFHGDLKKKQPIPFSINGADDKVLLEEEERKPSPKLLPDWCKEKVNTLVEKNPSPNVIVSLERSDSEEDGAFTHVCVSQSKIAELLNELPEGAKADLRGRVALWEEALAMAVGAVIGGGAAYGFMLLMNQSIFTLSMHYTDTFDPLLENDHFNNFIFAMALLDLVPRGASYGKKTLHYLARRGVNMKDVILLGAAAFLPSLISPFASISSGLEKIKLFHNYPKVIEKVVRQMLTYSPLLYLNDYGFNINMLGEIRGNIKEWAATSNSYFASLTRRLTGNLFYSSLPSPEEIRKRDSNKKLDALRHQLPFMSDEEVDEMYKDITEAAKTIAAELANDLDPDNLKPATKFLTSLYLLSWGKEVEQAKKLSKRKRKTELKSDPFKEERSLDTLQDPIGDLHIQSVGPLIPEHEGNNKKQLAHSWSEVYEKGTDGLNYTALFLGSPIRLIALKFIVQEMFKAPVNAYNILVHGTTDPEVSTTVKALSWTTAILVGFAIQTALEYKGMKNFREMFYSKDYEGHESYPWLRRPIKLATVAHGFILITSVAVLVLEAFTDLFGGREWIKSPDYTAFRWTSFFFICAYLYSEWASQVTTIEESYNQQLLTGAIDVYHSVPPEWVAQKDSYSPGAIDFYNQYIREPLRTRELRRDYQQDWLIRFIKEIQEDMTHWHPNIHFQQEKLLNTEYQKVLELL
jgi:hypothetical protein